MKQKHIMIINFRAKRKTIMIFFKVNTFEITLKTNNDDDDDDEK